MNETPGNNRRWQIRRALLIWLAAFILIALATGIALVTTDGAPNKSSDILSSLLLGVLGASFSVCLLVFIRWLNCRRNLRRALVGLAIFATLIAIFYTEEDWRGKRAWENCKRELEAKGAVLDWEQFIPPPVPDDRNFYKASTNIMLRFVRARTQEQTDAASQLTWLNLSLSSSNSFPILDFAKTKSPVVAELTLLLPGDTAPASANTHFTIKLDDPAARGRLQDLIQTAAGRSVNGYQGFQFSELQLSNLAPVKIVLQADAAPTIGDLQNLIPSNLITNIGRLAIEAAADSKVFRVKLVAGRITAVADYLQWSDQFVPAFDEVREALKRPYAVIPGDYSQSYLMPIPNFVLMRNLVQTLGQRTQCYLLLGQPEKALPEVTLMHDICRILERPPTGKPITLVEAMINVAISGLYVGTVADGFKLHSWQEPQMAAFQEQLKAVNLPPLVAAAFKQGQAASIHTFETTPAPKLADLLSMVVVISDNHKTKTVTFWQQLQNPMYLFLKLAPRGWWYQNLVNCAVLEAKPLDGFDLEHATISPRVFDANARDLNHFLEHKSPFKLLAAIAIPNSTKAAQTLAYNQTLANEAQIVCALERFHLAHGEYPETLDALMPRFIEKLPPDIIGGQPLHYRRIADGKFLLYSVGWNETDDSGQIALKKDGSGDRENGDWVWPYPAK